MAWVLLFITKIKWLLRLSKATLNLSVQDVGVGILSSLCYVGPKSRANTDIRGEDAVVSGGSGGQNELFA